MLKISFLVIIGLLFIQSFAYAAPSNFRIRIDGTNVTITEYETRKSIRFYQIKEAMAVKKLESELEARAVVLGMQIKSIDSKYYSDLANQVLSFINQTKHEFDIDFTNQEVSKISKEHFLQTGEQAHLLSLVKKAAKTNSEEASKSIAKFFDELEYVFDTDTISEYLTTLASI